MTIAFDKSHPKTLAFYCSDGRFTEAVEELVRSLGEHRLDEMCLPGGPGLLDTWTAGSLRISEFIEGSLDFLIVGHEIKTVVLIAHEGCGYYREHYPQYSDDERKKRQIQDLQTSASRVKTSHPGIKVKTFYASVLNGSIVFTELGS